MPSRFVFLACLALCSFALEAHADVCGRVDGTAETPTAADALAALKSSVGVAGACRLCLCDVDGDGVVASDDALAILRKAIGLEAVFGCSGCTCPVPRRLAVGDHPRVVRVADLNRDGNLDIVSVEDESRTISVLLGLDNDNFSERSVIEVSGAPMSVTVADVDGDAIADLVTANLDPSSIAILSGRGDGTFAPPRLLGAGDAPVAVAVGDINGDRRADLAAVNSLSDDVSVYVADGAGGYSERPRVAVGIGPRWIELVDLTGDGTLDAVTANRDSHSITILAGNGDGTFDDGRAISVCAGAHQALPADLNGDSKTDLVIPCKAELAVAVLIASGDGLFDPVRLYETHATAIAAAITDLDGDDKLDVAVTHWAPYDLVIFKGVGDGTLVEQSRASVLGRARQVALADVTGDALPDILVAGTESDDVLLFPGSGVSALHVAVGSVGFRPRVRDIAIADFDGDGVTELVSANWHAKSGVYQRSSGGFFERELIDIQRFPSAVITGNFNGDDKTDFIVKNNKVWATDAGKRCTDPHLALFLGRGDATFEPELRVAAANLSHHTDDDFAAADVDGDGIDDLVIVERQSASVTYMRGQTSGQFEVVQRIPIEGTALRLTVGKIDGDDTPDLAFFQGADSRDLVVRLRDEHLRFGMAANVTVQLSAAPSGLALGDVNGDGHGDLVTGVAGTTRVEARLGDGGRTFSAPITSDIGIEFFKSPDLIDADVDRALDLVGLQSTGPLNVFVPLGGPPAIARGRADGRFERATIVDPADVELRVAGYSTTALLATNLDADPALDFVVAYQRSKDATLGSILYNVGHCLASGATP